MQTKELFRIEKVYSLTEAPGVIGFNNTPTHVRLVWFTQLNKWTWNGVETQEGRRSEILDSEQAAWRHLRHSENIDELFNIV